MLNRAVILTGGKQYLVSEGQTVVVDKLVGEEKEKITFDKVLLVDDGKENLELGHPYLEGAKVSAEIIEQGKGEKIRVARFRAKTHYRKVVGFTPKLTKVKILKITTK